MRDKKTLDASDVVRDVLLNVLHDIGVLVQPQLRAMKRGAHIVETFSDSGKGVRADLSRERLEVFRPALHCEVGVSGDRVRLRVEPERFLMRHEIGDLFEGFDQHGIGHQSRNVPALHAESREYLEDGLRVAFGVIRDLSIHGERVEISLAVLATLIVPERRVPVSVEKPHLLQEFFLAALRVLGHLQHAGSLQ